MNEPDMPPTTEFVEYLTWLAGFMKRLEALADEAHAHKECAMEVPIRALMQSIASGQRDFFFMISQFTLDVISGKAPEDLKKLIGVIASGGFVKCEIQTEPVLALMEKPGGKPN